MMEWIRKHPLESALAGVAGLLAVVFGIAALVSSDSDVPTTTTFFVAAEPEATVSAEASDSSDHPDFEQINCSGLITLDDADIVFDVVGELLGFFEFQGGETCSRVLVDDENLWIRVEPGDPADFAADAEFEGSHGVAVSGVGDDARWFGGDEVGVLSVYKDLDDYLLYFRILLSRPETSADEELEIVTEQVLRTLPRFPGVVIEQPEPEEVTLEDPNPVDPASTSYVGNVLAKEANGEWSLGEGLIATLQLFAGEAEAADVLRYPDLQNLDRSAIVDMSNEYVATATIDDPAADQIVNLLSLLVPTVQSLEAAGDIDEPQPTNSLGVVLVGLVTAQEDEDPAIKSFCLLNYGTSPCMDKKEVDGPDGDYTLYSLKPEFGETWDADQIELVEEAVGKAAAEFKTIGETPKTTIMLNPHAVGVVVFADGDGYMIHLGIDTIGAELGVVQQAAAYAMAKAMVEAKYGKDFWLNEGMATYLSGVVFPDYNYEHDLLQLLTSQELSAGLTEWGPASWIFFEYLHGALGSGKDVFTFDELPPASITSLFHEFAEALSDGLIQDIGTTVDYVPYTAQIWDLPVNFLLNADLAPPPFGIRRIKLMVEPGQHACMDVITSGDVQLSWREGANDGGYRPPWDSDLPLGIEGESTLLITSSGEGFVDFSITQFVDNPSDCEEPPPPPEPPSGEDCIITFCDPTAFLWNPETKHTVIDEQ